MAGTENQGGPAGPGTLEEVIAAQAETIRLMQAQFAELAARVAPAAAAPVTPGGRFPMTIYRRGGKPGQVDHPGVDAMTVADAGELEAYERAGWSQTLPKFEYDHERVARLAAEAATAAKPAGAFGGRK